MSKVVHFEIPVDDLARAKAFYAEVFGWRLDDFPGMDYTGITTVPTGDDMRPIEPGAINGGMMARSEDVTGPVVVMEVASVDDALARVTAAGGRVVRPKMEIPGMGYYAYAADSEGNVIGTWENLPR